MIPILFNTDERSSNYIIRETLTKFLLLRKDKLSGIKLSMWQCLCDTSWTASNCEGCALGWPQFDQSISFRLTRHVVCHIQEAPNYLSDKLYCVCLSNSSW